jgi:hypothetical protein
VLWSESRDLGECEGAVETWDAAGERESAKCGGESRPGCNEQASAKICSRPVPRDLDGSSVKSASALHAAHAKKT